MPDRFDLSEDLLTEAFSTLAKLLSLMRLSGYILACYAIVQGILIIIGDDERFSQRGYTTAMLIPQAPESWGWFLGMCGVISFISLKNRLYRLGAIGMFMAGVWSFAFCGAFLVSAVQYPDANLTAIATYGKDGLLFLLMALAHQALSKAHTKPEAPNA